MKIIRLTPADNIQNSINCLTEPAVVYLAKGIYNQKTEITADNVIIKGEGSSTVLTYGDYAKKIHSDGKEYNTFRTFTLCITGNGVRLENLTVENSNTDPENVGQCVALSVHGKTFSAENVELRSTQDTLFLSPFPDDLVVRYDGFIPKRQLYREGKSLHIFKNCRIYGTVDFIFGGSEAYFKDCDIISVYDSRKIGFAAAPSHPLSEEYGFSFIDCNFLKQGAEDGKIYLARPWRDFGKCSFVNCTLENHISPELFDKWNDTSRDKTARFSYYRLKCGFTPSPVHWAAELTETQARDIINRFNMKLKTINS